MAKKTLQELQYEFDGLLKGAKRAEQLKGATSKFAPVFKARGMKGLKSGGPIVKRKSGSSIKAPKVKQPSWMKGLSEDQIKEMIGGPKVGGERRAKIKKKPSKVRKAKAGGPVVKKMGGGSMNPKKYMNKGGIVKRGSGGGLGDRTVAGCYSNKIT